jgi:hypothetical protein
MIRSIFRCLSDREVTGQLRVAADGPNAPPCPSNVSSPGAKKLGGSELGRGRLRTSHTGSNLNTCSLGPSETAATVASYPIQVSHNTGVGLTASALGLGSTGIR